MWYKIVGWLLIILGTIAFAKPEPLRNRLRKKGLRTVKRYLFATTFSLGALLISAGWRHEGALPKLLMVIGMVFIFNSLCLIKAKLADVIAVRFEQLPLLYLRLFALGQIITGVFILFGIND